MRFEITHTTRYHYGSPASESFMDVRLHPPSNAAQTVLARSLLIEPACRVSGYTDYYGNAVEQFSIIHRHDELRLTAGTTVETHPVTTAPAALDLTVSEARQIYRAQQLRYFDFVHPSRGIAPGRAVHRAANRLFRPADHFGQALERALHWIHRRIAYTPGATGIDTGVEEILGARRGVCQDHAHVLIAILRSAEIPARYVCGYIETESQRKASERGERHLVGAAESHAWVEIALPNGSWHALDPTNDIPAGERHVVVTVGRDFHDTSPTRGVFKGAQKTVLKVAVIMRRVSDGVSAHG